MKPDETSPGRDDGAARDTRAPKPCCNRLADGARCLGPADHTVDQFCKHVIIGAAATATPEEAKARAEAITANIRHLTKGMKGT